MTINLTERELILWRWYARKRLAGNPNSFPAYDQYKLMQQHMLQAIAGENTKSFSVRVILGVQDTPNIITKRTIPKDATTLATYTLGIATQNRAYPRKSGAAAGSENILGVFFIGFALKLPTKNHNEVRFLVGARRYKKGTAFAKPFTFEGYYIDRTLQMIILPNQSTPYEPMLDVAAYAFAERLAETVKQ